MKILVLNAGSSSLKFKLFESQKLKLVASGLIERIGEEQSNAKLDIFNSSKAKRLEQKTKIKDHRQAIALMSKILVDSKYLKSLNELSAIGHRVVHGGELFKEPVLIKENVINAIKELTPLAPLHNPVNLTGIELAIEQAPNIPQVAVFDTAFHQTIPVAAYLYALPYKLYEKNKIRRYGFHGSSHSFVAKQAAKHLGKNLEDINIISLHLGAGASVTAIRAGKSIDTSMGMTPLEGLIMGTRSGDLDPAIILYLNRELRLSTADIDKLLNKQSGLKGITGNNDMRAIIEMAQHGEQRSKIAIEMFTYRVKKYIGSYMAALGHTDAVVFTGGIGENSALIRELSSKGLEELGIALDQDKNFNINNGITEIQSNNSKIKILVVPTNEELEIASQTLKIITN